LSNANFIDHVKIHCRSGKGGAGSNSLFRDKLNSKGGPDGGDGGNGGSVVLRGNSQLWTLLHLKYERHIRCEDGQPGGSSGSTGRDGKDKVIEVPLGTVARDAETGDVLFEILEEGQEEVLLEGGKGGRGNTHFKSSTRQTPRYAQPGLPGQEKSRVLELKVLADVGLVGFPNAGKSTLLSSITAAKPKIANYPFTTLVPNLGIVPYRDFKSFVIADIPGIIEGASEGKGLGHRFLRHIERNSVLLFMVPADSDSIQSEYHTLIKELEAYNPEMLYKDRLLAISKADLIDEELEQLLHEDLPKDVEVIFISSVSQKNLTQLKDKLWQMLNPQ
jgi:GTP-binding protein